LIGDVMSCASGRAGPALVFWAAMTTHVPERFSSRYLALAITVRQRTGFKSLRS
jgi:hypothetical protein